jgi:aldehyde dehydrogenase (NAD+)
MAYLDAVRPYGNFAFDNWACASLFRMYANMELQIHGKSSLNTPGMINLTLKQPYGVVAAIIPWNVSLIMFAMKVAPALVAGNAIIVKSSEKAPLAVYIHLYTFQQLFPSMIANNRITIGLESSRAH